MVRCCLPVLKVLCVYRATEREVRGGRECGGGGGVLMDLSQPGV